jgi:hypothetical protein
MRVNDFARLAAIGAVLRQFSVASSPGLDAFVSRQLARDGVPAASLKSNLLERTGIVMIPRGNSHLEPFSMTQLRLLGLSGSRRRASSSTAVLRSLRDALATRAARSTLKSKPVLTMTTSPAFTGGVRAQQQMNETLALIPARLVFRPQIVIGGVHEKVRDGRLIDEAALSFAVQGSRISSRRLEQRAPFERRHDALRRGAAVSIAAIDLLISEAARMVQRAKRRICRSPPE